MINGKHILVGLALLACAARVWAQEAYISLREAEAMLRERNLLLQAERYGVAAAEATLEQAGRRDNPTLDLEQSIYNGRSGRYLDLGPEGQTSVALEQPLALGGKRGRRVALERANAEEAGHHLDETLRELRHRLRGSFAALHYARKAIAVYDKEIDLLVRLVATYELQYDRGNVSYLEKARLKALLFALRGEKAERVKEQVERQQELNLLLGLPPEAVVHPLLQADTLRRLSLADVPLHDLQGSLGHRPDLRTSEAAARAGEAEYRLQQALRVPDLSVRGAWVKDGSFGQSYAALGLSVALPCFDRNRGGVKAALARREQRLAEHEQLEQGAAAELYAAYRTAEESLRLYQSVDRSVEEDFDYLIRGVTQGFEQRNISLPELADYYRAYKEACLQLYEAERAVFLSLEQLCYAAGRDVYLIY